MELILIAVAFLGGAALVWRLHDSLVADLVAFEARVAALEAKAKAVVAKV